FMLDTLDVADGMSVLEIGTGTGYTAGLLCHRLGDHRVASIDIHPDLVTAARQRLASLGYRPNLAVGDGAEGMPSAAPYDRILSTAATPTIPAAWIDQLCPGGKILTDTRGDRAGGLVLLTRVDPDTVTGRFVPSRAHFMWLRPIAEDPIRPGEPFLTGLDLRTTGHTTTTLDPAVLTTTLDFWFFTQLLLPGAALLPDLSLPAGPVAYLATPESFAMISPRQQPGGTHTVDYGGADNPWRHVEAAWQQWHALGTPTPGRFGLTATHQRQWTWLDNPDHPIPQPQT
ncbi:MAG TPA: methyltransferase domain-containing protein, partial [Mycobacteriales bacterium]|nr:methyltransferase domain-containing protein [Mycobacteriales bacterium]